MPYINQPSSSGGGAISGVTVTGAGAAGKVPVASSAAAGTWSFPPGFEFGYDQITAPVTVSSATEATGTTIITCAAHTFDGGPVMCQFFGLVEPANVGNIVISLFEGATQIARLVEAIPGSVASTGYTENGWFRFTPTAASHTYTVTAFRVSSNGTIQAGAGGTAADPPAFVRFTKV